MNDEDIKLGWMILIMVSIVMLSIAIPFVISEYWDYRVDSQIVEACESSNDPAACVLRIRVDSQR